MNPLRPVLCGLLALFASSATPAEPTATTIYMADGQLLTHTLSVYTHPPLSEENKPRLCLPAATAPHPENAPCYDGPFIATGQTWSEETPGGQTTSQTGTLLQFDVDGLSDTIPWYKSVTRVTPRLEWVDPREPNAGKQHAALANGKAIYLGNPRGAAIWTLLILATVLVTITLLARRAYAARRAERGSALLWMVSTADGRMSMALTQMALWTLAVGGVVLGFSLVRMTVPDIPDALVWLMGLAAGTGAIGHYQTQRGQPAATVQGAPGDKPTTPAFFQLLTINAGSCEEISLAKAQVLFWTVITLALFISKSLVDGQLWTIPEELVVLMGISQASFLGRQQMAAGESDQATGQPDAPPQPASPQAAGGAAPAAPATPPS